MSVKIQTIINIIEAWAPKNLAEDWDNVGLQIGDCRTTINKIMLSLDITHEVVDEAINEGVNMIITHHPLIFKPVKNIRFDLPLGGLIAKLVQNDIAVYTAHTNLDSAHKGINDLLASLLDLNNLEVLVPSVEDELFKLVTFVPKGYLDQVRNAISEAGAGWIGNYSHCTFSLAGTGTFMPLEGTSPFIGTRGKLENVDELRVETIIPQSKLKRVLKALMKSHPYEEVAYDVYPLANEGEKLGLGRIGELNSPITLNELVQNVKKVLNVDVLKVVGEDEQKITKIAVCGGAGASLINNARFKGAQCLITGDLKYHEAHDAQNLGLSIIDAGHHGTENIIVPYLVKRLKETLTAQKWDVEVLESKVNTNPWRYY